MVCLCAWRVSVSWSVRAETPTCPFVLKAPFSFAVIVVNLINCDHWREPPQPLVLW